MITTRTTIVFLLTFLLQQALLAQEIKEVEPPEYLRTIIFKGPSDDQFPILKLGEGFTLSFDDLKADESDYYYRIIHCDHNWTPSRLLKSEYLSGNDNQRIRNYNNSYNTLVQYSNYQLRIPNAELSLKVSGNYLLEIYNSYDELMFSRRFLVYENLTKVAAKVKRNRDFDTMNSKQNLEFTLYTDQLNTTNPKKEIHIAVLQNYNWNLILNNIHPQYNRGNELIFRYDNQVSFFAGNEYLNFDTKDIRAAQGAIAKIELADIYEHWLYGNRSRAASPYTYFPDINGDFRINTTQGSSPAIEADYTWVHFSLEPPTSPEVKHLYISGKFNNHTWDKATELKLNKESNRYQASLLLKQGFYNYKYIATDKKNSPLNNLISGNFHTTENQYHILVYYRKFGSIYDRLVGIGVANSSLIEN